MSQINNYGYQYDNIILNRQAPTTILNITHIFFFSSNFVPTILGSAMYTLYILYFIDLYTVRLNTFKLWINLILKRWWVFNILFIVFKWSNGFFIEKYMVENSRIGFVPHKVSTILAYIEQ